MRQTNIVLFSSGVSEGSGLLDSVKQQLTAKGYTCSYWRDLFTGAHDMDNIALLPILIKKIPTFDFAVLICEGHDRTYITRGNEESEVYTMRDNVLFEIGLCSMALGLSKVILLTDSKVRMPDDLTGIGNSLAVKRVIYDPQHGNDIRQSGEEIITYIESFQTAIDHIHAYIQENLETLSPVVIGAAASTACGYVENFIFRTLEKIDSGVLLEGETERRYFPSDKIFMHIILPEKYAEDTPERARRKISQSPKGCVPDARMRVAEFRYQLIGDTLHIYDYPTTLSTSYNTAKIILSLNADETNDQLAGERFITKEMTLFEGALHALLSETYVREIVSLHYRNLPENEKNQFVSRIWEIVKNQVTVERVNY